MAFTGRAIPTKFASENWWVAEVTAEDAVTGALTLGTWEQAAIRVSNSIEFARSSAEEKKSETDKSYLVKSATVGGSATLKMKVFRTTTKALIDMAIVNANKKYAVILEVSENTISGKYEYILLPKAQISGNFSLANSEETDLEFMCSPVIADVTVTLGASALVGAKKQPASMICRKDLSFDVTEVAP